ncbi:ABC transporter permease [Mucilaginibacter myungsuensis]|uniref:ABC transporter permease n=1 Tax=Mucilaginibacter myungsuensis TaxID=649104 RepID=A0A929PUC6_9SPHI|nr:ABC transporter permease [Mucilaginibacter myungsuensis]MBE9660603.1 ABC transporter permease [Mucilaginibacter myungsuensis]MDN3600648.1 ABC transporter permease [Mucilaginibacter myungsuensis]
MIKNYIKIAWRNLLKSKLYSFVNILGLTIGLTIGMLILLWVQDEMSFDTFHSKVNTIYRVNGVTGSGQGIKIWDNAQGPVATTALREIPGVRNAVRISHGWNSIYTYKDKLLKEENTGYTDPSFFVMFDFRLIKGSKTKPFPTDQSVIITESTAKRYFGDDEPVGKVIQQDHETNFTVSGVIADFPDNSSIKFDMLFPINIIARQYNASNFWKSLDTDWGNYGYSTFFDIKPGTSLQQVCDHLINAQKKVAPWIKVSPGNGYRLQPMSDIHFYQADGSSGSLQTVKTFLIVGIITLLIACINYVNLSTARAMLRAKEVSIRKIIGAQRRQLFAQFIIESVVFFCVSLFLAFGLLYILMPYYNDVSGKHLQLDMLNADLWKVVAVTFVGTLAISSIYPSLLLSSFEPLKALKGKLTMGIGQAAFRKILVTTQFVFSVTLIIVTVVIGKQLKFIREKDPGYDRSQVFSFRTGQLGEHLDAVKAKLKSVPGIRAVTSSDNKLVDNGRATGGVDWDGKPTDMMFIMHHFGIDENFMPVMNIKLKAGKNFSGSKADATHFILNETAIAMTGIKDPIGKRFKYQETEGTIIGVVKDFNAASFKQNIDPAVIYYQPYGYKLYIKTTGKDAAQAIAACKQLWDKYNSGFPFEYRFMDEEYDALYKTDQRSGVLFNIFSAVAIVISCLGLFGLATYTAQIMMKEIGIRKVLGASVGGIIALVSKDFLKLVVLAIVIASPIAWWAINKWLEEFVFRIDVGSSVFLISGAIAIGIAVLTISFQTIRAATANPVKSLRSE